MASRNRKTADDERALDAAQVLFTANPVFLAPQTKHFFQAQQRFFHEVERFSSAWLQRRQDATRSIIDVGKRIASSGGCDPARAFTEIADWQTHFMDRLAEDAKDCVDILNRCASALVENEAEAVEEVSETATQATKSNKS